ncbi:MAG: helix-turn-helix transcriptional regulator [Thermodesulfobacteriota bacterium]|nr:helix-turn-helix transcriptional regulator [Thermodesulfobacteriota bacterium]
MDYYSMTDRAIGAEIGQRFKQLRLRKNFTQEELSKRTLLSLTVIKSLESGKGKLSTIIAVLRELDSLDNLDSLIPDPGISPMLLAKMKGKERKRATGKRGQIGKKKTGESEW